MNPYNSYIGCAVTIILREGYYHGTIHRFDTVDKRITLKDVSNPENGNKYPGIRHFYASEILDMTLDDDDFDQPLLNSPQCAVIQTNDTPAYEDAAISVTSRNYEEDSIPSKAGGSSPNSKKVPESPLAKTCDRYTIIEEFDNEFQNIMSFLQDQMMLGFHLVSIGDGRDGKICWIAVSVESHAYLFDFLALGRNLFKNGMKEILESEKITKIIHDCRFISDLLFHKFSVNLTNVFDTQVADAFAHRAWYGVSNRNNWPKFVQPLSVCLFGHLKLSTEEIVGISAREGKTKVEQELWPHRPLSIPLAETLVSSVIYLDDLRCLLLEKMMVEFRAGVHIYLGSVRDLEASEVAWYSNRSEHLPKAFNNINKYTQVIKDGLKERGRESFTEFSPFENNFQRREIFQHTLASNKMNKNSKSVPYSEPISPVANQENTGANEFPNGTKKKANQSKRADQSESVFSNHKTSSTRVPNKPVLTSGNDSSPGKSSTSKEEDIFIEAAKKMISSDIPSDLMDLLRIPTKNPSVAHEPSPKPSGTTTYDDDSAGYSSESGVEWSRYRKENSSRTQISLLPAGHNRMPPPKKRTQGARYSNQLNNENKNPIHRVSPGGTSQKNNSGNQMTDTFFEIPEGDSHAHNVLGQIQSYSASPQKFQYSRDFHSSHSYSDNNDVHDNNANNDRTNSPSSPAVSESKSLTRPDTYSNVARTSSQELPSNTEQSVLDSEPRAEVQNGSSRNYWVNGSGGHVGNGGMTHIERLMAVWRNNSK